MVDKIMKSDINKLIIVDVAAERNRRIMVKLRKHVRILVIDHHPPTNNLNKDNIIHINPHFEENKILLQKQADNYCASKIVYDICSSIINIKNLSWISSIGIIGDNKYDSWKGFIH